MRLYIDCIRDIIIAVADTLIPDEDGYIEPINPVELAESALSNYPKNEVMYWIRQLMDAQILIQGPKYIDEPIHRIKDLSFSGHQFINAAYSVSIWDKMKPKLLEISFSSISFFIQKAIEIGMSFIG